MPKSSSQWTNILQFTELFETKIVKSYGPSLTLPALQMKVLIAIALSREHYNTNRDLLILPSLAVSSILFLFLEILSRICNLYTHIFV